MKSFNYLCIAITLGILSISAKADVRIGISADNDGVKSFHLSIGEHYRVPEREVLVIRNNRIHDDELPVVFFIARHARVEPGAVVKLRSSGKSWMDITLHFGLSPAIYYVAFEKDPGPPYGKAWGYYKNRKKDEWKSIRLRDGDIVNFVNVKFMCDRYGYKPGEVVKMRAKGDNYVVLNDKIKKAKFEKGRQHSDSDGPKKGKGERGKGKSK